jgi:signal transduction histidine kinase
LDNAIKFTSKGEIEVACELDNQVFEMKVRDTGKGIAAEALPFIADSFRQASEGLNRQHQGAGLGLTMVKGFLNILGGELLIESEENKGSIFTCRIPVQEAKS